MGSLFGKKSSQTSDSYNKAYDSINTSFSPLFGLAGSGGNALQALLSGDASGFNAYKGATGFDQLLEGGSRGITGNAAARGLLRSGSTGKALTDYGNTMQNQYAGNYIQQLLGLSGLGMQAGGLVANAGQTSHGTSTSSDKSGLTKALGNAAGMAAASDRRLKKDIEKIGEKAGINIYKFKYINEAGPYIGVMADEVKDKYPDALGPVVDGYMTVDYNKLEELINA